MPTFREKGKEKTLSILTERICCAGRFGLTSILSSGFTYLELRKLAKHYGSGRTGRVRAWCRGVAGMIEMWTGQTATRRDHFQLLRFVLPEIYFPVSLTWYISVPHQHAMILLFPSVHVTACVIPEESTRACVPLRTAHAMYITSGAFPATPHTSRIDASCRIRSG